MEPARYVLNGNLTLENRSLDLVRSLALSRLGCLTLHIKGILEVCKSARLVFFLENTLPNALDDFLDREYQNMKYMFLIVDGDVTIKEESGANNVVILSKEKITIENNVNFSGSMQAKKGIFISPSGFGMPVNLRYKEECVKPNRDLIAYINSPP